MDAAHHISQSVRMITENTHRKHPAKVERKYNWMGVRVFPGKLSFLPFWLSRLFVVWWSRVGEKVSPTVESYMYTGRADV